MAFKTYYMTTFFEIMSLIKCFSVLFRQTCMFKTLHCLYTSDSNEWLIIRVDNKAII